MPLKSLHETVEMHQDTKGLKNAMPHIKTRSRSRSNDPLMKGMVLAKKPIQPVTNLVQANPKFTVEPTSPQQLLGNTNYRSRNSLNASHNNKEKPKSKSPGKAVIAPKASALVAQPSQQPPPLHGAALNQNLEIQTFNQSTFQGPNVANEPAMNPQ